MTTLYENHASSRLLFDILATDTALIISQSDGDLFPDPQGSDFFWLTLDAGSDGLEIVKCISRTQDTMNVIRAQQGTTATAFSKDTLIDSRLTAQGLMNFLQRSGGSMNGNILMNGYSLSGGLIDNMTLSNVKLENFTADVEFDVPRGIIAMLSSTVSVPTGWAICNGANGTPDLRNKFILSASTEYPQDATGGSTEYATEDCGPHDHAGTTGGTALDQTQLPDISLDVSQEMFDIGPGGSNPIPRQWRIITYKKHGYHIKTSSLGDGLPHSHALTDDGTHKHQLLDVMPPFYALVYIMKL